MDTNRRYTSRVRDGGARYAPVPAPAEPFEAARVLDDLSGAATAHIPCILARYAALRAWLLRDCDHAAVRRHARSAARAHLSATDPDWTEGRLLEALLLERPMPGASSGRALELLGLAAGEAQATGHVHGARALREAVHRARWFGVGHRPPSAS